MNYEFIGWAILWLVAGWVFTYWFVNHFLEDRRWSDTGTEVGPGTMVILNIFGPVMAMVMLLFYVMSYILYHSGDLIRRFYGVRD